MEGTIATYEVNVGDGDVVKMTGDPDKLDRIVRQMQVHGRMLEACKAAYRHFYFNRAEADLTADDVEVAMQLQRAIIESGDQS